MHLTAKEAADNVAGFSVAGEVTIYHAAALWTALRAPLAAGRGIALDFERVTELDCAGLQVLLMAKREAGVRQVPFAIDHPSAQVLDVLETLNLMTLVEAGASN